MKKTRLLLMALLVFVLSIALVACSKDEEKDDDDKETSAPKATVEAQHNNVAATDKEEADKEDDDKEDVDAGKEDADDQNDKEDDKETQTGTDSSDVTVVTLAKNWIGGVIDDKKVDSISFDGKAVLDMKYQGTAIKLDAVLNVEITKEPLVMKMNIDMSGDLAGTPADMKQEAYVILEDGKAYMIMSDPTGQSEGFFKYSAEDVEQEDMVESMTDIAEAFEEMDFATVNKDEILSKIDELVKPYMDVIGTFEIVEENGEYVLAGTITEEQINDAIGAVSDAAGEDAGIDMYAAMLPKGYGGIDYRLTFDKDTCALNSAKIDFSKLAKAFVGDAGENYIEIGVGINDVSAITVPEAQEADLSTLE